MPRPGWLRWWILHGPPLGDVVLGVLTVGTVALLVYVFLRWA